MNPKPCRSCSLPHPPRIACSIWVEMHKVVAKSWPAPDGQVAVAPMTQSEKMKEFWRKKKAGLTA